ncbi:MAG: glycosyltransferase family 2 protein [Limisphaerales bacterium]
MNTAHGHCPSVSVVVLSYDRPACLATALSALACQTYANVTVTVVDNQSPQSAQVSQLMQQYPAMKLIQNRKNLGYTGGMNQGIMAATGHYIYLTEDDMVCEPECIQHLAECAESSPTTGLFSGIVCSFRDKTIEAAGGEFDVSVGGIQLIGTRERDVGQFSRPFPVTFIPGCMVFARRVLLQRLQGPRADFFMYGEDVELCVRVVKAGYGIMVAPKAKAFHQANPATRFNHRIAFHSWKNALALHLLHAPWRTLPKYYQYSVLRGLAHALVKDRKSFWPRLRATVWLFANAPRLLAERAAGSKVRSDG